VVRMAIALVLIGRLTITSYRSVPSQTDDSPFNTSTGERVYEGGIAVSRDLLCPMCRRLHHRCKEADKLSGTIHYGDYLYIEGTGVFKVNDVMGETKLEKKTHTRIKIVKAIDIWKRTYLEEKNFGVQRRSVYKLQIEKGDNYGHLPSHSLREGLRG